MKQIALFFVALVFALPLPLTAGDILTANVLTRVLMLHVGDAQGTGFTIEVNGRQYVVTAKHLVPGTNEVAELEIYRGGKWLRMTMPVLRHEKGDVAVLIPPAVLTQWLKIQIGAKGAILGQEVFLLGFPYGISTESVAAVNNGYPAPFIKRGTYSATYHVPGITNRYDLLLVDGIGDHGFSGGPVVALNQNTREMMVLGVISRGLPISDKVVNEKGDTGLRALGTAGFVICEDIQYALDLIKGRHDGPKAPEK